MIVHSTEDRADFAKVLWRRQVTFYFSVCAVRLRVAVYPLGWASLDVAKLTQALENMRDQVAQLGFQPMSAAQSA
jgi:hypothetical protein